MVNASSILAGCAEDPFSVGGGTTDDFSKPLSPMSLSENDIGDQSLNCDGGPIEEVIVYGYAPSFSGFGEMIGITFSLTYLGGSSYIATSNDDVGCNSGSDTFEWSNAAFRKYRAQLLNSSGYTAFDFARDHPTGSLWTVELPSGQIAVYRVANPIGHAAINTAPQSCS